MSLPTEPIPGSNPTPPVEQPAQPSPANQARQEFFAQAPVGPAGRADRIASILGTPKPETTPPVVGPQPILSTEPFKDPSVDPDAPTKPYSTAELRGIAADDPTNQLKDMATTSMLTGLSGDNLITPAAPYLHQEPQQPEQAPQAAPSEPTTEPVPAPKKPWWKIW